MASFTNSWIFLGNFPEIDTNEADTDGENFAGIVGATIPSSELQVIDVTITDSGSAGSPGFFDDDEALGGATESASYTLNGVTVNTTLDDSTVYNVAVTVLDPPPNPLSLSFNLAQFNSGDLFLVNSFGGLLTGEAISAVEIQSVAPSTGAISTSSGFTDVTIACFAAEAGITLASGRRRAAGALRVGDRVRTLDHGAQTVRWIARRRLDRAALAALPHLRPIRIPAGALGRGLPRRALLVSPQHRVLVASAIAARVTGHGEVLVPAKALLGTAGIAVDEDVAEVTYVHFLCDRHEVVFAEGAATETLYAGPEALKSVAGAARAELLALFPELSGHGAPPRPARPLVAGKAGRKLAARHAKNAKPICAPATA